MIYLKTVLRSPFSVLRSPLGHFRLSFLLPFVIALVFAFTACEDPSGSERDDDTSLAGVTGLSAAPGNGQVTLSWTDPADADLASIEITWTGGSVTAEKSTAENLANSKTITGLTNGTEYTFTVKAVDATGNKSAGVTAKATPEDAGGTMDFTVASTDEWTATLAQIKSDGDGTESNPKVYTLNIEGEVSVPGTTSSSISGNYKTVRLTGEGTLSLLSKGSIFYIGSSNQTLIIDGPTLQGRTDNDSLVVSIILGAGELRNGTISGNSSSSPYSGGVDVGRDGTFTMSGGEISGNSAYSYYAYEYSYGGGVYVGDEGTFTMSGGEISGNSSSAASSCGGGVYVGNGGTFTMQGGTNSGNKAGLGGGVYSNYLGTFTKTGGTVYGDDDDDPDNGNDTDNTATSTANDGKNGHAVFFYSSYYRNETLEDGASGNISTTDTLPAAPGETLGNWTMR
jgi:hypothetical protein